MTDVNGDHHPLAAQHLGVARDHAHMGTALPPTARGRRAKQLLVTALRPITNYQTTFNAELADAVAEILGYVDEVEARAQSTNAQLYAAVATAETSVEALGERVTEQVGQRLADIEAELAELRRAGDDACAELRRSQERAEASLRATIADQQHQLAHLRNRFETELKLLRSRQDLILRSAREALPDPMGPEPLNALSRELSRSYDELYRDLESTFRGSRAHVKDLARSYLGDVVDLDGGPVVDIGCGRGEWLEVLHEAGVPAYGVDLNQDFVAANVESGLDVRQADALEHLRQVPESSLRAITMFHGPEHLSLDTLVELVDGSLQALQRGGVLILETPNPTNLRVGAASFYLDPTHLKPIHPDFLRFLVEARGFVDAEVRYLHAAEEDLIEPGMLGQGAAAADVAQDLNWALYGPLDYAVVARKVALRPESTAAAGGASDGEA